MLSNRFLTRALTRRGRPLLAALAATSVALTGLVLPPQAMAADLAGCTITGTVGSDVLHGTDGDDVICGGDGDDLVVGGAGNDRLIGGNGADTLDGGDGDDALEGGNGADRLLGGSGSDLLNGGDGDDTLVGGDGQDMLYGEHGSDLMSGGIGADVLDGGAGADRLFGGRDADQLVGAAGDDRLLGGPGADHHDGGKGADVCQGSTGANSYVACEEQFSTNGPDVAEEDSDGDRLPDDREIVAGTDPDAADSDGDLLTDGDEVLTLTDPTSGDSDLDGVPDGEEDTDEDGVTNGVELSEGTIPFRTDSDGDGLGDGEEKRLGTDPLDVDSDDDSLDDGDEVALGADPLLADSDDDGTPDGQETYTHELLVESQATLTVTGVGASVLSTTARFAEEELFGDVPGVASRTIVVDAPEPILSGTLTLPFDPAAIPAGHEVAVLHFDDETGTFDQPADQVVDLETGRATVTTGDFSPFVVVDITQFAAIWETEIVTPREGGDGSDAPLDAALVLDASGSMSWNDPSGVRRTAAKAFVDELIEGDRAAAISFDTRATVLQALTTDLVAVKAAIDRVGITGGTDIGAAVRGGLDELDAHGIEGNGRYVIVLTDGEGPYDPSLTTRAVASGTIIYTVGLGASVDVPLLDSIATATGGKFFHVAIASDLVDAFTRIGGDLGAPDTDGDGIADVTETSGWRDGAGRRYVTNPTKVDTDGDGLGDGDEAGLFSTNGAFGLGTYYNGFSDPTRMDSEGDGLDDAQELDLGTHPRLKDSDMDGLRDLAEVEAGFEPLSINPDGDYAFDDQELSDGTDPFGYDFEGLDNVHAGLAGFWFGDAWESLAAQWAQVNVNVASSPWYLVGQIGSGLLVIGDIRDVFYGLGTGAWGNAAWAAAGVIPIAGDALKSSRAAILFAAKSPRAVRAAVEVASRHLPSRYVDDIITTIGKTPIARLARDAAVRGLPAPVANFDIARGAWSGAAKRISGDAAQAQALNDKLAELVRLHRSGVDVRDVRVNQRQVDFGGDQVGINRPDLQYTIGTKRYYVEWDKPLCTNSGASRRGDGHGERIYANDPGIAYTAQVLLLIAGRCE